MNSCRRHVGNKLVDTKEEHFAFGVNWQSFLGVLNETRIEQAKDSFSSFLGDRKPAPRASVLDVGCGSGLMSLVAQRCDLAVTAFDFDDDAVACALELKRRFGRDSNWLVEQGDVLDPAYMARLGSFDLVYAWGSLHHTGDLWRAVAVTAARVKENGLLWLAIYNDQGGASRRWLRIKKIYRALPTSLRTILVAACVPVRWWKDILRDAFHGDPLASWRNYGSARGMSPWYDMVDWVGGYPFEVAKPEQVIDFLSPQGFLLERLKTCGGGIGCNEFLFRKSGGRAGEPS